MVVVVAVRTDVLIDDDEEELYKNDLIVCFVEIGAILCGIKDMAASLQSK